MIASYQRKQTRLRLKKRAESPANDQGCHSNAGSVAFQEVVAWGCIWLKVGRHRSYCLCWKWTPSPPSLFEQAFEILPSSNHKSFTVDPPELPQAKAPHAMPLFGLSE